MSSPCRWWTWLPGPASLARFIPLLILVLALPIRAQVLLNVDFGAEAATGRIGVAATGQGTNDFWNSYSHYLPRYRPGMDPVPDGSLEGLRLADGSPSTIAVAVTNAPGVWGNNTGDRMLDRYLFAPNGSNLVVTLTGMEAGRYHFHLYGWGAPDVAGEQVSRFRLRSGTNLFGMIEPVRVDDGWVPEAWRGRVPVATVRDVPVIAGEPVVIEVLPGSGGVAVLNGLQAVSRGTEPPRPLVAPRIVESLETNLTFRSVEYVGQVDVGEARFSVAVEAESRSTNQLAAPLFEGDLALLDPALPDGWRVVKSGGQFFLLASVPGTHRLEFALVARVQREEPWNVVRFTGPAAAAATLAVTARDSDVALQLLNGVPDEGSAGGPSTLRGVLGADRAVAFRWQGRAVETTREALVMVDTQCRVQLTPAAIRHATRFTYEAVQGRCDRVKLILPSEQTLTRLTGELVKDWQLDAGSGEPVLTVEFVRPLEGLTHLELESEQTLALLPGSIELRPPTPLGVQRESGRLAVRTEDLIARLEDAGTLRQVNAEAGEWASYQFSQRPVALRVHLSPLEPLIVASTRVRASLEETRWLAIHELGLNVTRAGVYGLELEVPPGWLVAEVRGLGIEEWQPEGDRLRLRLAQRLLGDQRIEVHLEQPLAQLPPELLLAPVRVVGATRESALIGAGSTPGLQLKTASVTGAREIPVTALPDRRDELLAYRAEGGDWRLTLAAERLSPRVVAEVFHLVTIGDGLVGGGTTIRFGIVNQGVQQFRLRVPAHWRNLEFIGPNIRRKDRQDDVWTIALQDKVWSGYTLVVTYDYAFDPHKATLDAGGAHPLEVERETGAVAITSAGHLALEPVALAEPLRRMDPSELAAADRALIARPVLLAYRYEGPAYTLALNLTRHEQVGGLDAVADRAQFISVLSGSGEMLTQASFLVKNNERPHQRFELPARATLWGVAVNGEPVRPDRDGNRVVVALPRGDNRDQLYAIDLKYAEQVGALGRIWPRRLELVAPRTDLPGTYAEWILHVPTSRQVFGFGGTLQVARGTTYGWRDGWDRFLEVYRALWHEYGPRLIFGGGLAAFLATLIWYQRRRGFGGVAQVVLVFALLAILAGMLLPALSKAKAKAQRINSVNNLKQIGLAARLFANDNAGRMPDSFEQMMAQLATEKVLIDPETGQRYTYVGVGKSEDDPNALIAYSPERPGGRREVVFADGSVQQMSAEQFLLATAKDQAARMDPRMLQRYGLAGPAPSAAPGAPVPEAAVAEPAPAQATEALIAAGLAGAGAMAAIPATATGIKSLKFDLPRAGRAYTFTRVLSPEDTAPTIRMRMMSGQVFVLLRAALQASAFVVGLFLVIVQWRRAESKARWLAVGLALVGLATADLLIAWRVLHVALTVGVPVLLGLGVAWAVWRWRGRRRPTVPPTAGSIKPPPVEPAPLGMAGTVLLVGFLGLAGRVTQAEVGGVSPTNDVALVRFDLVGTAHQQSARIEATASLVAGMGDRSLRLFGPEVAVEDFATVTGEARVTRDEGEVIVRLPRGGSATVKLTVRVRLVDNAGRRQLDLALPPALGGRLTLAIEEPDVEIEFPGALSLERRIDGDTTVIDAVLGGGDRLNLSWTARKKRAADIAATVFAQQVSLVTLGRGVIHTRTTMDWQVSQGEVQQVRARLPAGSRLLKAGGAALRSWELDEADGRVLTLDLLKPLAEVQLTIETEKSIEQLPFVGPVTLPEALEVKRQTGLIGVRAVEELGLSVERAIDLERIDNAEFIRAVATPNLAVFNAWRFLRPQFDLALKAELLQPRIEVGQRQHFTIGLEQTELDAQIDYTISRLGVFALRLQLPAEGRIESVTCEAMDRWAEHVEGDRRILELTLKERVLGPAQVGLRLVRASTNLPPTLALAGVLPLDTAKRSGYVAVSAGPGVGLKTSRLVGAIEIPPIAVPGATPGAAGTLAFKHLAAGTGPELEAPWQIELATEQLESWVRAELVTLATVAETLISGRTLVRYEIQNAPTREFRLQVPPAWRNVELIGAGVRRRDQTNGEWRLELQSKVQGTYSLTVLWEMARDGSNRVEVPGPRALGVERETGGVALFAQGQLQLIPEDVPAPLLRIEARELPAWALAAETGRPVLSYRYLRPGWTLNLDVRRFQDAAVLQGLVDAVRLRTVIAEDGQQMTQMDLEIRNNGRQNLSLALPTGSQVWSAFVDGQPVRPARRDGRLLLPLERPNADSVPIAVEVTYVGRLAFPRTAGRVELESPRFDLPLKDARWELFVPPDFTCSKFAGTMNYESAELVPVTQDFTLAEYQRQESSKQDSFEARAVDWLRRARSEVATGKLDQASQLKGYRDAPIRDRQAAEELKRLEADVNRFQSAQLIEAQRAYAFSNNARLGGGTDDPRAETGDSAVTEYDARVAEQQVTQLQKAQALAESRVAPLRVNLPTRGLRYSFVQVLQTEPDKPLRIRFHARSDRESGWFRQILFWLGGFGALWWGCGLALALRPRR